MTCFSVNLARRINEEHTNDVLHFTSHFHTMYQRKYLRMNIFIIQSKLCQNLHFDH